MGQSGDYRICRRGFNWTCDLKITPNQITISRIIALPFAIASLYQDGTKWAYLSWLIFFLIGLSDIADGKLARSSGQVTALGAFLDPVADKLMIASAMIPLSLQGRLPWWATIAILVREIGITLFRSAVIRSGVIPANRGGKLKTFLQGFGVGWFILPLSDALNWFKYGWLIATVFVTYLTWYWYLYSWLREKS